MGHRDGMAAMRALAPTAFGVCSVRGRIFKIGPTLVATPTMPLPSAGWSCSFMGLVAAVCSACLAGVRRAATLPPSGVPVSEDQCLGPRAFLMLSSIDCACKLQ
jgi:hypothetical protein